MTWKVIYTLLLLASVCCAQSRLSFDRYDAALAGAMLSDELSTAACTNCREVGTLKSTPTRIGFKLGLFSTFKLLDYYYPQRRALKITKLLCAGGFLAATVNNLLQGRR